LYQLDKLKDIAESPTPFAKRGNTQIIELLLCTYYFSNIFAALFE